MNKSTFSILISVGIALAALFAAGSMAQDQKSSPVADKPRQASAGSAPEKAMPTPDELEATFKATFTKATLSGRWCSIKDGELGPDKEDKYTIVDVSKVSGDNWIVRARIQYSNRDIVAPIPLKVKWAGDTPVLIVEKMQVPGGGVFSARVLIYGHTYAGSWTGGDHSGLLNGLITNESEEKAPAAK